MRNLQYEKRIAKRCVIKAQWQNSFAIFLSGTDVIFIAEEIIKTSQCEEEKGTGPEEKLLPWLMLLQLLQDCLGLDKATKEKKKKKGRKGEGKTIDNKYCVKTQRGINV